MIYNWKQQTKEISNARIWRKLLSQLDPESMFKINNSNHRVFTDFQKLNFLWDIKFMWNLAPKI